MTALSELKEQLRKLVSGEPVYSQYGKFNFPMADPALMIPDDGFERYVDLHPGVRNRNDAAAYARDQLMKDIEILERMALEAQQSGEPEQAAEKPQPDAAKKKTRIQLMWDQAILEAHALAKKHPKMTLSDIADNDEVNACFTPRVKAHDTIVKRLQGKGITGKKEKQ